MLAEFILLSMSLSDHDPSPYHPWRRFPSLPSLRCAQIQIKYYCDRTDLFSKLANLFPEKRQQYKKYADFYSSCALDWSIIVGLQSGKYGFTFDNELSCETFHYICELREITYDRWMYDMTPLDRILAGQFYWGD